ncbi:TPA: restriction endonuclease [Bacillus wiedmannii]|nr:restriction endonuclease [Bacillus wiedmannii]HDR7944104.1 restriction endonuclease [Bacillus wiedmannii]HDR7962728.1 restriction endonuclease [Bacillus wiedmannii]
MLYKEIISKVTDEKTLRRKIIMELFSKMGYQGIKENHGQFEFGKDVVFYREENGERHYVAVVAKKGDVRAKTINDIIRQVNQCLSVLYPSSEDGDIEIKEAFIITDGKYLGGTPATLNGMIKLYDKFGYKIHKWDGDDLKEKFEYYYNIGVEGSVFYETYSDTVIRLRLSPKSDDSARLIQILHFDDEKVVEVIWKDKEKENLEEIVIYDISGRKINKMDLIKSYLEEKNFNKTDNDC